jgi:hypothetical protein
VDSGRRYEAAFLKIRAISSASNARIVVVRTLPVEPSHRSEVISSVVATMAAGAAADGLPAPTAVVVAAAQSASCARSHAAVPECGGAGLARLPVATDPLVVAGMHAAILEIENEVHGCEKQGGGGYTRTYSASFNRSSVRHSSPSVCNQA